MNFKNITELYQQSRYIIEKWKDHEYFTPTDREKFQYLEKRYQKVMEDGSWTEALDEQLADVMDLIISNRQAEEYELDRADWLNVVGVLSLETKDSFSQLAVDQKMSVTDCLLHQNIMVAFYTNIFQILNTDAFWQIIDQTKNKKYEVFDYALEQLLMLDYQTNDPEVIISLQKDIVRLCSDLVKTDIKEYRAQNELLTDTYNWSYQIIKGLQASPLETKIYRQQLDQLQMIRFFSVEELEHMKELVQLLRQEYPPLNALELLISCINLINYNHALLAYSNEELAVLIRSFRGVDPNSFSYFEQLISNRDFLSTVIEYHQDLNRAVEWIHEYQENRQLTDAPQLKLR